jgi:phage terminase large subunit-like protein
MMATAIKERSKIGKSAVPKRWRKVLLGIPGYDPFRYAPGCWFEPAVAEYYIEFIETCCTHIEGDLAGEPFLLEPWQKSIQANLFGWKRRDSFGRTVRRYRKVLIYVPKKNGKTPMAAADHNACFFLDDEVGQINNLAAASRDQATKLYRHIVGMINNEPQMRDQVTTYATTRTITRADNTVTKVIPADENVAHGDNPHFQAIDELHAQPDPRLYHALTTAMASLNRKQPLLLMLTTADYDRPSVCNDEYRYAIKVRDGIVDDETYLPVIYEAYHKDADGRIVEDDWRREDTWYKANPNLGISVSIDYLRTECRKARENPAYENVFKRLHLNVRTEQAERVISMEVWDRNDLPISADFGQECWAALDIGATRDLCAFVKLYRRAGGAGEPVTVEIEDLAGNKKPYTFNRYTYGVRPYFWIPEHPVARDPRMEDQIEAWCQQGLIKKTPGNVVDYDQVAADIVEYTCGDAMIQLAVDQGFQGMQITQDLQKAFGEDRVVGFRQGILSMAAPCRELLELIEARRFWHGGHPVLRWMASNVAAERRGGLVKFSKDKSPEKIDGMTASTMALAIAMTAAPARTSVYETRGIRTV